MINVVGGNDQLTITVSFLGSFERFLNQRQKGDFTRAYGSLDHVGRNHT